MEIALGRLFEARGSLAKLLDAELPIKEAYNISKILKSAQVELDFFENERKKLIKKHGDKPDENGDIKVKEENISKFTEEFQKVLDMNVNISGDKVDLNLVNEKIKLTPKDIILLEPILENMVEQKDE